jgi:type I restriction enzyme, S subunit
MKHELVRYDAYKDSGVEWLGEVPEHWEIAHLKRFCTKITDGAHTSPDLSSNDYAFLTVVNLNNGILDFKNCLFTSYIDYEKLVRNGCQPKKYDVLYSKDGTISETAVIDEDRSFVVGSSFIIVRPNLKMSNSFYLCYFLTSDIMRYQARIYVKGASIPRISIFNIAKLISIIPPLQEQKAIADYLDTKTAQIDRKIDLLTQKAIQYGKLKQSLINETVTHGLNKTVAMKDSGVEWIGEMPEHWEISKLSQAFNQIGSGTTPKSGADIYYEDGTTNWINTGDLNDGILYSCKKKVTDKALKDYSLTIYPAGSIIIAMYGATIGKVSVSMIDGCTNQACCVLNKSKVINIKFLFYWFLSTRDYIISLSYGGGQPNISQDTIKSLRLILPLIEEQKSIADYLDTKTAHIDRIIETINTQIDKFKELRKTLINDVVTGKIKVA